MLNKQELLLRILRTFLLSLLFAVVGFSVGSFVPLEWMIPLIIFQLGMLIFAFFLRKRKKISYGFLFVFTLLSGVTMNPIISSYVTEMGANLVLLGLVSTVVIFSALALYSWKSKRDFTFLGGILLAALLALIIVSIFNIFFPIGSMFMLIVTIGGILVFSGFILYDISVIKKMDLTEEDVPLMALNLYLDFINLFLYILRLLGIFSKD